VVHDFHGFDGDRLYEIRSAQGFTQEKLAEQLNVSQRIVSCWELGDRQPPVSMLCRIARLLHVDPQSLLATKAAK